MKIRRKTAIPRNAGAVLPMLACLAAQAAEGGFLEDAKTDLVLRNYYFNRDFRDHDAGKSLVDEWAQGFILKFSSGYTPGTVGVGLDAIGLFGVLEQRTWHQQFRASSVARRRSRGGRLWACRRGRQAARFGQRIEDRRDAPGHSAVALRRRTPAAADVPRLRRGFPRAAGPGPAGRTLRRGEPAQFGGHAGPVGLERADAGVGRFQLRRRRIPLQPRAHPTGPVARATGGRLPAELRQPAAQAACRRLDPGRQPRPVRRSRRRRRARRRDRQPYRLRPVFRRHRPAYLLPWPAEGRR